MRPLTARLEDGYCSITVANHRLITIIRLVVKSYTHPWKDFTNKLRLVLYACKIFFSRIVCYAVIGKNKQRQPWIIIGRAGACEAPEPGARFGCRPLMCSADETSRSNQKGCFASGQSSWEINGGRMASRGRLQTERFRCGRSWGGKRV